ncbi:hypothetical protein ABVT39_019673 [Epinephelus coioides]
MATLDAADSPGKLEQMLNKAYKKIANLLEDTEQMSNELQRKDSLLITLRSRFPTLTNWLETSRTVVCLLHSKQGDPLDRSGHPRAEEGSERGSRWGSFSPDTTLQQVRSSVRERDRDPPQETAPVPATTDTMPPPTYTTAFPPLTGSCPPAGGCPTGSRPPAPTRSSSQRKRLMRDAVRWHSSRSPRLVRDHTRNPGVGGGVAELACSPEDRADAPTTLVIGDSIMRHVRMREAFVVPRSHRYRRNRENTGHPELPSSQVTVFISGPTPTCGRGIGSFSRLLSLNTWLSSACNSHHVNFINNFDVFSERRHLFGPDGLHLNRAGARMLSANLAYGIQHAIFPKPAPAALSDTD